MVEAVRARSAAAPLAASMTAVIVAEGFWKNASIFSNKEALPPASKLMEPCSQQQR
jgi:hypothetical protein